MVLGEGENKSSDRRKITASLLNAVAAEPAVSGPVFPKVGARGLHRYCKSFGVSERVQRPLRGGGPFGLRLHLVSMVMPPRRPAAVSGLQLSAQSVEAEECSLWRRDG